MLSKSQAKLFFLATTAGFSCVFLGLTVDTIRQVPARSNADQITPAVVRGKELWESNNCMGCHTILGEGAYYAPELTKVVERRGVPWLQTFLKDPEAMFPGQRKMVKYDFTDEEIDAIIAFLAWNGKVDTNGFPAEPDMRQTAPPSAAGATLAATASPPPPTYTAICASCHSIGGVGGAVGPALDGLASRYSAAELDRWLADPQAVKPGTAMPKLNLDDPTRAALITWLLAQK
jgi:nitric oxide reductase subunit C